uniref:Uncharacterized protein n=1 Tax=uncultured marine microorganism HF4000_ANIW141I9 TaxID=455537 RepID=B3T5G3_9ZZZZ|nr:hypothetical protein ALOHA_HF4000ANIW141I9ctg2g9 [uncultured marine microorganism HF4000_ANIW141I9]
MYPNYNARCIKVMFESFTMINLPLILFKKRLENCKFPVLKNYMNHFIILSPFRREYQRWLYFASCRRLSLLGGVHAGMK